MPTSSAKIGRWRSSAAREAYVEAYQTVLRTLPEPTRTLDVETEFGSVRAYEWEGTASGPPVLLLPGRASGAPMWAENLSDWIGQRTIYAIDAIGDAGLSVQTRPFANSDDQAEWIAQTITGLGVDKVHSVGHSFGGAIATIHALRHPEQVATLALLEPVLVLRPPPVSSLFWATITQLPLPRSWKDRALAELGGVTVEEVRVRTPLSIMIDHGSSGYRAVLPTPRMLTDQEWRSLPMPLRADFAGTKSLAGGTKAAERLRSLRPDATVELWPNASHSLPMQERAAWHPRCRPSGEPKKICTDRGVASRLAPVPIRIRACIVNHNTSVFAELALRSLAAAHVDWLSSGRLRITIMDNHSTDEGLPNLIMACDQLGVEFTRSRWPVADSKVNSHGDVMREFVAAHPTATHFLFADADTYQLEDDTVGRMAAELAADDSAWAIQARFPWVEEHDGPGRSLNPWAGRIQRLGATIEDTATGPFAGQHKPRCHPAFSLVVNTDAFRRVADVVGLSSAVIIAVDPEIAGFADTFGLATLAMQTHGLHHALSSAMIGHYHGVSYQDPNQPADGKLEDCQRRLALLR
ncbi:alpha/beta fold hydrolase [Microlunatus speluncae]|uniref:alpha/beta fold hydrolase n=1 Tax=Microlunatus speluncae TaxID=2594267 RepID=UPI001C2D31AA|nr:alpha/beta fold hydrolase [Microlunatus speluncae]